MLPPPCGSFLLQELVPDVEVTAGGTGATRGHIENTSSNLLPGRLLDDCLAHQRADAPTLGLQEGGSSPIPTVHAWGCLFATTTAWLPCTPVLALVRQNQEPEQGPARLSLGKEGQLLRRV